METKTTSPLYTINWRDFGKGLLAAVISAAFVTLYKAYSVGGLTGINWDNIADVAIGAGLAYISQKFFSKPEVRLTDVSKTTIKQVKKGNVTANLFSTPKK